MNKFLKYTKRGFTLIELLIVIIIIAILAGVVLVAINPAEQRVKARLTTMKNNVAETCNAQAVCLVGQEALASCSTFAALQNMTAPYPTPNDTTTCSAGDCLGIETSTPWAVQGQSTVGGAGATSLFTFRCHNDEATAGRGSVVCSVDNTGGGTRVCATYGL